MNQRLANRLHELETVRSVKDKPIMYLWVEPDEDAGTRLADAASALPDKQIIAARWLGT